jgi:DNA-binding CsgD family transcriptional regulator
MKSKPRIKETVKRLDAALAMVRQDRWQLAGLRSGRLVILAEGAAGGGGPVEPAERVVQELTPLARRALYERRAVSISTIQTSPAGGVEDWELDWPTILYAPVADPGLRPAGLLILGVREPHWYEEEDVNYIAALAATLTGFVTAATDPLRPLTRNERMVAYLLGEGLSSAEVGRALRIDRVQAQEAIGTVLKKLKLRSTAEVADLLEDRREVATPISLALKGR